MGSWLDWRFIVDDVPAAPASPGIIASARTAVKVRKIQVSEVPYDNATELLHADVHPLFIRATLAMARPRNSNLIAERRSRGVFSKGAVV